MTSPYEWDRLLDHARPSATDVAGTRKRGIDNSISGSKPVTCRGHAPTTRASAATAPSASSRISISHWRCRSSLRSPCIPCNRRRSMVAHQREKCCPTAGVPPHRLGRIGRGGPRSGADAARTAMPAALSSQYHCSHQMATPENQHSQAPQRVTPDESSRRGKELEDGLYHGEQLAVGHPTREGIVGSQDEPIRWQFDQAIVRMGGTTEDGSATEVISMAAWDSALRSIVAAGPLATGVGPELELSRTHGTVPPVAASAFGSTLPHTLETDRGISTCAAGRAFLAALGGSRDISVLPRSPYDPRGRGALERQPSLLADAAAHCWGSLAADGDVSGPHAALSTKAKLEHAFKRWAMDTGTRWISPLPD